MPAENVIPKAVQAQVKAAEEAARKATEADNEPEPKPDAVEPTAPVGPVEPEKTGDDVETPAPDEPQVEPEAQPETPPEDLSADALAEQEAADVERLRQAHKILTGKYSKEVPRYAREVRQQKDRIQELEDQLARQVAQASVPPVDSANPYDLSEEERELGEEVVTATEKIAKRIAEQQMKGFEDRLGKIEPEEPDDFLGTLASMVPDYDDINTDPAFLKWLGDTDPVYGVVRDELLKDAQDKGDGVRAANMFLAWKKASELVVPKEKRPSVAAQVGPRTVASNATPPPKKTYTRAEYESLMSQVARAGSDKEHSLQWAKDITKKLDQAVREGRIRS